MGGSKAQTVGYRYLIGMHMGVCHGPVDEIQEIRAGDKTIWAGERYGDPIYSNIPMRFFRPKDFTLPVESTSPVTDSETINIFAPNAFGGDDREGGISGFLDVMMGKPDQTANAYLSSQQTGPQPAYRGLLGLVFRRGLISSNNPYIKPWSFRLKRTKKGWDGDVWYPEKAEIDLGDGIIGMNAAHIIYECFTNRKWGHGMSPSRLNLPSFVASADTLFDEGFGLCMLWAQQESVDEFIQKVVNHIGAAVGEDPRTGLYRLKLLRDDYDIEDLPVFSYEEGNLVSIENFDRSTITEAKNEITVRYNDQASGKGASVTMQNIAVVQASGTPSAETVTYAGVATQELATRLGARDLKAATSGIGRLQCTANRTAAGLLPGDVIGFSWPEQGIDLMPIRVASVDYGSLVDGKVRIAGVQDIFGLPLTTYIVKEPTQWQAPPTTPQAAAHSLLFEMPYRDLVRQLTYTTAEALDPNAGYIAGIADRPAGANFGYQFETRTGSADYLNQATGEWCPWGTLTASMAVGETPVSGTLATFGDLDLVGFGQAAFIDNEMVRVDSYNPDTGAFTFARGCGDTIPAAHAAGARVWFYETFEAFDPTEWANAEVVDAKFRTVTTDSLLSLGSSPGGNVTMANRAARPYAPGLFRINGGAYPASIPVANDLTVSWAHRDRIGQQDQLVATDAASVGPEVGTTYTLEVINATTSAVIATYTGLTGTSQVTTAATMGAATQIRVKLKAVRGGLDSRQSYDFTFNRV